MAQSLRNLLRSIRRRPGCALGVATALVLAGWGVERAGRRLIAEYHDRAARQALERRDFGSAQVHLLRALKAQPDNFRAHWLLARAARCQGDFAEAARQLRTVGERDSDRDAIELERALLDAQQGQVVGVQDYLRARLEAHPAEAPWILEALVQGYLSRAYLAEALACVNELLRRQPEHVRALLWRGHLLERRRDIPGALADYRRAVELDPANDKGRLLLAETLLQHTQLDEALEHFECLSRRQPAHPGVLLGLARCRHKLGQLEEAHTILEPLVARQPPIVPALTLFARLEMVQGRLAEAEGWLTRATERAPSDYDAAYNLYVCLLQAGKRNEAAHYLPHLERVEAAERRLEEVERRLTRLTTAVFEGAHGAALRTEAGILCLRLGRHNEALDWLAGALLEDPAYAEAHETLAAYHEHAGHTQLAARHRRLAQQARAGLAAPAVLTPVRAPGSSGS